MTHAGRTPITRTQEGVRHMRVVHPPRGMIPRTTRAPIGHARDHTPYDALHYATRLPPRVTPY